MYDKSQMLLFLLLIVASSGEDTHLSCQSGCFYDSPESCPSPNQPFRCRISPICSNAVICCNLTNDNIFEELRNINNESNQQYRALHIMQSSFDSFNNNMTGWCRFVESFAVTNGEMRSFDTEFPRHIKTLTCLNLTSNGITELNNSLKRITNLRMLDVSRNKLKKLPAFGSNQNITLDISNNSFQCEKLQEIMKSKAELHYKNGNITWCAQPNNNTWFNVSVYLGLYEIERMNEIETVCPKNCTCTVHRVDVRPEHKLQSSISFAINCAEKQLTALPSPLPDRTIALNVSGNNIESLAPIKNDTSYKDLREFYAYHNNISDILPLEGSNFISNFVALNLRYNNIKSFPAYMFMNTFDRNNNIRTVRLGQNRIICNCDTARILKVWLGMAKRIEDSEEIFCEGTGKQVVALDVTEMCKNELGSKSWVDYIYFVIAAEIALLATLIAKVSYDYWVFKTKGYLPWPASKMPKLPCDWLCE